MKQRTLIHVLFWAFLAASCRKTDTAEIFKRSETVIVAWSKDVNTLDPACAVGMESAEVVAQMYEPLVTTDPVTRQIKPLLAREWNQSSDGLVWDFTLRTDVLFHDGTPMEAEAVVFSFRRQLDAIEQLRSGKRDPASDCGFEYWKAYFDGLVLSVKALDRYRVRIVLKYPYAPFLNSLEMFAVRVVRPFDTSNKDLLNHKSLGTGAFRLASRAPERVVLERFDQYWNKEGLPAYRHLVFQTIRENRQRLLALEGQRIDFAFHLSPSRHLTSQLHPRLQFKKESSNNTVYMALNTAREPFAIRQVRLAVNHAINRDKIVKIVYQGMADLAHTPLSGQMTVQGKPVFQEEDSLVNWYGYDPEKAMRLLEEAGYGTGNPIPPLTLYLNHSPRNYLPDPILLANLIRNDLARVGISVEVRAMEYTDYKNALKLGLHDMALHGWVGEISDPDEYLYGLLHGSNVVRATGMNHAFFQNGKFDDLVKRARQEHESVDRRIQLYRQAMEVFRHEAPWVPLAHSKMVLTASMRLKNIEVTPATFLVYQNIRLVDP